MGLEPGNTLGRYVVVAPVASGGMGEVYKARDTRLDRTVAIKVIGSGLSHRSEFRRRFDGEARAIAALSHPHICTLYDTGQHEGSDFLVMEYLEGETLAQRLRRGPLPWCELQPLAIDIAEALAYAHRQGIVHRDVKPANVFLTRADGVKLLDFGAATLRRATSRADVGSGQTTQPLPSSEHEATVGTLNYLAPERFDGREADARSDVFAFGATLYEMATGRKAFDGNGEARVIASILSSDPTPMDAVSGIPRDFEWLVRQCLIKDPDARWQSMSDVAAVLRSHSQTAEAVSPHTRRGMFVTRMAIAALVAAALVGGYMLRRSTFTTVSAARRSVSLSVLPPIGGTFGLTESSVRSAQFAMAPDGRAIVFVGAGDGGHQLWIRELGQTDPRPIPGTARAAYPFWSADGQFIAFFADHWLKKVGLTGRAPQIICSAQNGRGGAWRKDGTIVFAADTSAALSRTDAAGTLPVALTTLAAGHLAHRWPQFLPDGRVLFFVRSANTDVQGIYVTSIDRARELHRIRATGSSALYAAGRLLFVQDDELFAQPLELNTLRLSGEAVPLGLKVSVSSTLVSAVSASEESVLATWSRAGAVSELVWFDDSGRRLGTAGAADRYVDFRLSPDERHLALSRVDAASNTPDLALLDLTRSALSPLPSSSQTDATPVWSADGTRLVFRSNRRGLHDLFERPAQGGGEDRLIYSSGFGMYPTDWSSDGRTIIFHGLSSSTRHDIWALDLARGSARPLVQTVADEAQGQLAPGNRLAYTSDETGSLQVYVRALDGGGPVNVSVNGGFDPRWRADGRELFFISSEGALMAADVSPDPRARLGPLRRLFTTPIRETSPPYLSSFVVTRDGRRFLLNIPVQPIAATPVTVTLDWPNRARA